MTENSEPTSAEKLAQSTVDHIGVGLWRASNAFVDEMYRRAAAAGFDDLSAADGTILAYLPPTGLSITALARARGATKQATHEAVRKLETRGILKIDPDPDDKRVRRAAFTARGLAFVAALQSIKAQMQAEAEAAVGAERLADVDAALAALAAIFSQDR